VKYVRVARERGARTFVLVFDRGDDLHAELQRFMETEHVRSGRLSAVGGFSSATLGYYAPEARDYEPIAVAEQVEVLSLLGTIAVMDGKPAAHMHGVVGFRGGAVKGGHVKAATVWPTLEAFVNEYSGELDRVMVPDLGIGLVDLS
jgi:predicted DNA-binding protein with PD1-like motif